MSAGPEARDCVVVGGNLAGLFVADTLSGFGFRTTVVEPGRALGGWDRSFANRRGTLFDRGVHSLAYRRSELVTRYFRMVLGGRVRHLDVVRELVLRGHRIPYNAPPSAWPRELRGLLREGEIVDDLGKEAPTRENLGRIYGPRFADLVYDEVLPSYPSEHRHAAFGVEPWRLLTNIYPWFFPRVPRVEPEGAGRRFQDKVRRGEIPEQALYPREGGFGAFVEALERRLRERGVEIVVGASELAIDLDPETRSVHRLAAGGLELRPERVYWCAGVPRLCRLLGDPEPELGPDHFVLGSFELERPIPSPVTEILVADPAHPMDRVSFRGNFAGIPNRLVQVEFAHPREDPRFEAEAETWRERWLESLRRLGIVEAGNAVLDFDFKKVPIVYNSYGVEGQPMPEVRFELPAESNLRPVLPTVKKVNINTRIPEYLRFLAEDLASWRP